MTKWLFITLERVSNKRGFNWRKFRDGGERNPYFHFSTGDNGDDDNNIRDATDDDNWDWDWYAITQHPEKAKLVGAQTQPKTPYSHYPESHNEEVIE